ncbi:MAG: hypothetical protein KJP07_12465 [Desulfatitalea sp.]|nr:hypothetical protein [Desulfatitalea sp.]
MVLTTDLQLAFRAHAGVRRAAACGFLVLLLAGCAGVPVLPEVDLSAPGWRVVTGQALWTAGAGKPPVAGELIIARHTGGDRLISFSKPPIPMFTAQTAGSWWRIDFVERGRTYSGRGRPPERFVWFTLPEVLAGGAPPKGWRLTAQHQRRWSLVNRSRGEEILMVVDP